MMDLYKEEINDLYKEIKGLEEKIKQYEEAFDKIRAEIEEYKSRQLSLAIGVADLEKGKQTALGYVLGIITKYRAESEG